MRQRTNYEQNCIRSRSRAAPISSPRVVERLFHASARAIAQLPEGPRVSIDAPLAAICPTPPPPPLPPIPPSSSASSAHHRITHDAHGFVSTLNGQLLELNLDISASSGGAAAASTKCRRTAGANVLRGNRTRHGAWTICLPSTAPSSSCRESLSPGDEEEAAKYGDVLLLDVDDNPRVGHQWAKRSLGSFPSKSLAWFSFAARAYPRAAFIAKADDDSWVGVPATHAQGRADSTAAKQ